MGRTTPQSTSKKRKIDKFFDKSQKFIKIAGKIATLVVHVRGKPRALDYIAFGATALEVMSEIREETAKTNALMLADGETWLEENGWEQLHYTLIPLVFKNIRNNKPVEKDKINVDIMQELMEGKIGEEIFRWPRDEFSEKLGKAPNHLFYLKERYEETMAAVADAMWDHLKTDSVVYDPNGLKEMIPEDQELFETSLVRAVYGRAKQFVDAGCSRGILIDGTPGTGKSLATRMVLKKLGFRVLHVKLSVLDELFTSTGDRATVDTILRMLRPEGLVIDDVDRVSVGDQPELLGLLEVAKKRCKIVLVTTNDKSKLLAPLLRPGRLDDLLEVPPLDREIIDRIVGDDSEEVFERIAAWPISYIRDYAERKKALGVNKAREELDDLQKRVEACMADLHDPKLNYVDKAVESITEEGE